MKPMKPLTLLLLAAGMGSRYGGLKQIDPVGPGGETIMDYSIYDAVRAGFGKLVFVIRRDIEAPFKQIIGARFAKRLPVEYVFQELDQLPPGFSAPANRTKLWGTGQAILAAARTRGIPVLTRATVLGTSGRLHCESFAAATGSR
jgi:hypothetical protein